jgi:hypothetical protein
MDILQIAENDPKVKAAFATLIDAVSPYIINQWCRISFRALPDGDDTWFDDIEIKIDQSSNHPTIRRRPRA